MTDINSLATSLSKYCEAKNRYIKIEFVIHDIEMLLFNNFQKFQSMKNIHLYPTVVQRDIISSFDNFDDIVYVGIDTDDSLDKDTYDFVFKEIKKEILDFFNILLN